MMPAKTRQQIAIEYGVSFKTLMKWLKNAEIHLPKGSITPYYQRMIHEKLGAPNYQAEI